MGSARGTVAALAIVAAAACILLVFEAGERMYATLGPTRAAVAADGSLYLLSHGKVHVFATDGTRRSSFDLAALGVTPKPSELALHADGRVVFADPDTSMLVRCTLPGGPCERLDVGLRAAEAQPLLPLNSVRVAIDDVAARYYISDNAGHRVVIADFSGRVLAASAPRMFRYPNQLAVTAPGELTVSDTNHHRVVTFDVRGDRIGPVLREVWTLGLEIGRPGRAWPFDAQAMPGGESWALVADGRMRNADLVVFDAKGQARRRIDLGPDSDPLAIRRWNDRVLVADATSYRVVDAAAPGAPPALRDAQFAHELQSEREGVETWRNWRLAAQAGLVAIPMAAILALWKLGAPLLPPMARPGTTSRLPSVPGLTWIDVDGQFMARMRRQVTVAAFPMILLAIALFAAFMLAFSDTVFAAGGLYKYGLPVLVIAASPLLFFATMRSTHRRIASLRLGASDEHLHVVTPGFFAGAPPRERRVKWRDVYFDGQHLLAGRVLLTVKTPRFGWMFPEAEFAQAVASRLPGRNRVGFASLVWRGILAGSGQAIGVLAAFVAGAVYIGWRLIALL